MSNVSMVDGHIDRPMTNYDRIKNMSVEKMAEAILHKRPCNLCVRSACDSCSDAKEKCEYYIKQWLETEVEE